jgi:arginase family enzyme
LTLGSHLVLDNSWLEEPLPLPVIDARRWGPQLRFSAPSTLIEEFYREFMDQLSRFLLYGSGDFHYLSALWLRRVDQPAVVVSFDNHPDWDIRPPKWACGGWVNRALELPHVRCVSVWGCGNFECWWPWQIFGNRRAERRGRLQVHPWADDRPWKDRQRRGAILRDNWQEQFAEFVRKLDDSAVYVTIDLDCLRREEASTNWENGRFSTADVIWALAKLRERSRIIAGDICGTFSPPTYARWKQRFAAEFDHPKLSQPDMRETQQINQRAMQALWPALAQ